MIFVFKLEGCEIIDCITFPNFKKLQKLLLLKNIADITRDNSGCSCRFTIFYDRNIDHAFVFAANNVINAGDIRLDKAAVKGAEINFVVSRLFESGVVCVGESHQQCRKQNCSDMVKVFEYINDIAYRLVFKARNSKSVPV